MQCAVVFVWCSDRVETCKVQAGSIHKQVPISVACADATLLCFLLVFPMKRPAASAKTFQDESAKRRTQTAAGTSFLSRQSSRSFDVDVGSGAGSSGLAGPVYANNQEAGTSCSCSVQAPQLLFVLYKSLNHEYRIRHGSSLLFCRTLRLRPKPWCCPKALPKTAGYSRLEARGGCDVRLA